MKPIIVELHNCHLKTKQEFLFDFLRNYYNSLKADRDQAVSFTINFESFIFNFRTIKFMGGGIYEYSDVIIKLLDFFEKSIIFTENKYAAEMISNDILNTPSSKLPSESDRIIIEYQNFKNIKKQIKFNNPQAIFANKWSKYKQCNKKKIFNSILDVYSELSFEKQPFIFLLG